MNTYKLLTPGPLTTTETVRKEMMFDHCTWDDDYKAITQKIRKQLQDKLLIIANGAYGERMEDIAVHAGIPYVAYDEVYYKIPDAGRVEEILKKDPSITHVAMVHSETTSGILNDIQAVGKVIKEHGCTFIVDAMSSFGGVDIPVKEWGIDFIISSANKCIQGVPGFSFIIADRQKLIESEGKARSLSLDLYDQWKTMNKDGKWRFTSPTHVVLAFSRALDEMMEEGGISARSKRYYDNNRLLIRRMKELPQLIEKLGQ